MTTFSGTIEMIRLRTTDWSPLAAILSNTCTTTPLGCSAETGVCSDEDGNLPFADEDEPSWPGGQADQDESFEDDAELLDVLDTAREALLPSPGAFFINDENHSFLSLAHVLGRSIIRLSLFLAKKTAAITMMRRRCWWISIHKCRPMQTIGAGEHSSLAKKTITIFFFAVIGTLFLLLAA